MQTQAPANTRTQTLVRAALCCALLCVTAQIVIPVGPVPFSMGVFGVALAGALQRPALAAATVACYWLVGLVGLPVFASFTGGPAAFLRPAGGFLAGYLLLAVGVSLAGRVLGRGPARLAAGAGLVLAALAVFYLLGAGWFAVSTGVGLGGALAANALFIPLDLIKIALALGLAALIRRRSKAVAER